MAEKQTKVHVTKVQVATGLRGSAWWITERKDATTVELILIQEVALPGDAILAVLALANLWRAMRSQKAGDQEIVVRPDSDQEIVISYTPGKTPVEKLREVTLQIGARLLYMPMVTLLRLADTLARYREAGHLQEGHR